MKAYQVVHCSCDGGRIGKVWAQHFFVDETDAKKKLDDIVNKHNQRELDWPRKDTAGRLYKQDTVDGVLGWCNWCYLDMVYMREIEVVDGKAER